MYSLPDYGKMLGDKERVELYGRALKQSITPDSVVLEIGTGTGTFAMEACRLGARKVYAIDTNDVIQHAIHFAKENGCGDRIRFFQADSSDVNLPEQVDIIISDLRGKLPLHGHHLPDIIDARKRFLAAQGVLIPRLDTLWSALSYAPELYQEYRDIWDPFSAGLNTGSLESSITNQVWWVAAKKTERLVSEPRIWQVIDYRTIATPNMEGEVSWQIREANLTHGIRVWFDALLADNIGFSNHPYQPEHIYGNVFFPWAQPVALEPGDNVTVSLKANLVDDDYVWRWNTCINEAGNTANVKADFRQSSFGGAPISLSQVHKQAADYTPNLSEKGIIDLRIMLMMEKGMALKDIAQQLCLMFPDKYSEWRQALKYVSKLSVKYSK